MDFSKATGPDNLSPKFLKECKNEISESLCLLLNRSFTEGIFPNHWKKANLMPVPKSKDRQEVANYRPVSLLSIVSKIAEKCIYNHIHSVIYEKLNPAQHGFTSGKSTTT